MTDNPLFMPVWTGYMDTPPFGSIDHDMFEPAVRQQMDMARDRVDAIASNPAVPNFDNTIVALEYVSRELDRTLGVFYPLTSAACSDTLQEAEERLAPELSRYHSEVSLNRKLWNRVEQVWRDTDRRTLSPEEHRLLDETYNGFRRSGAALQGNDRQRYSDIRAGLSELSARFASNVRKATAACVITLTPGQAEAVDAGLVRDGRIALSQPVYMQLMRTCPDREVRRMAWQAWNSRCVDGEYDNRAILARIVALRSELAALLGYGSYAEYVLERNMAATPDEALRLLDGLCGRYRAVADVELSELAHAAGLDALKPWDYDYWHQRQCNMLYHADEESMRPYFPLDTVLPAVLGLARELYGVEMRQRHDVEVYNPDVLVYEAFDIAAEAPLGLLYIDLWARPDKRPGAWMTEFRGQSEGVMPLISIVTNFRRPAHGDTPLLAPREVTTLLHEFGHALHGLLSDVRFESLGGTNVRRDFVELPSQLNENFFYRPEWLSTFARHYLTGEPFPRQWLDNLNSIRSFGAGYAGLRQLGFGYLDMAWHMLSADSVAAADDVRQFETEAMKPARVFEPQPGTLTSSTFSHIFAGGYAAGYYSYKWSEMLSADAFTRFASDEGAAAAFRREILARGNTDDPMTLYMRFMRRRPEIGPLLAQEGLG